MPKPSRNSLESQRKALDALQSRRRELLKVNAQLLARNRGLREVSAELTAQNQELRKIQRELDEKVRQARTRFRSYSNAR